VPVDAFVRQAEFLFALLAEERGADARASGASDVELRFIQRTRGAASCGSLPPHAVRRQMVDRWAFRPGLGERLLGLEQWFSTLGAA
jgi:hypothetical protein